MVFHHASENTINLLKQFYNVTKKYVIIGEELSSLNSEKQCRRRGLIMITMVYLEVIKNGLVFSN